MVNFRITIRHVGITFGIIVWAFLWFWPMLSNLDGASYAGIDYILSDERYMAEFFYFGVGVGIVVIYSIVKEVQN